MAAEETVEAKNVLVTGRPGVGKTTLIERVVASLRGKLRLGGFTTGEILDSAGRRLGFRVTTLDGRQAELARVGLPSRHRVGRYGVNLEVFERLAVPELGRRDLDLLLIDEIGTMECGSGRFRRAVEDALDGLVPILATVGRISTPFLDAFANALTLSCLPSPSATERPSGLSFVPGGGGPKWAVIPIASTPRQC